MVQRPLSALAGALLSGLALAGLAAGCAGNAESLAPAAPDKPWNGRPPPEGLALMKAAAPDAAGTDAAARDFAVPRNAAAAALPPAPFVDPKQVYDLPELIDLAQRTNPTTRMAWEAARRAALAVGMAEATYLPLITANVIGGSQTVTTTLPTLLGGERYFNTTAEGVSPNLALQWLVFDFGERSAVVDAARQNSLAANVLFNASHQKLIFDVTRSYYACGAAEARLRIALQALSNSMAIRTAAEKRAAGGLATSVEVAQARQMVAQEELRRVEAEGALRDARQGLLNAMGVNPMLQMRLADSTRRPLPDAVGLPVDALVEMALAQRPDVAASYAAMKASRSGIDVARAGRMPKVFLAGAVATGTGSFNANGLPTIGQQASGTGVLVGATVPIFDGGLRAAQVKQAESLAATAESLYRKTQSDAAAEVVASANALRTALESYRAASALVRAAATTYDAALEAYRNGVGTITAATAANNGLLDAREAQADAHAAALVAAANLAFVMGAMTSTEAAMSRTPVAPAAP
ncbi:TolC family protein [Pseudoxanthobacter sp.]|uniref:TolC family protein n=1 Tax=Pseudoxanthobacter sp. TaxID=1925742 RepID=UPI002FE37213